MKKEYTPIITIFKNFLPDNERKIVDKYCRENKDNFEFVGYGSAVRWREYTHSKNANLQFKRSFLMTEDEYSSFTNGKIEEPYPEDSKHGDNYKMYMDIPTHGLIHETLTHMLKKTEQIILDAYGHKTFRESGPWLTHSSIGDHMKLHCDGTFIANRDASTDFSSVYYVNDDYEGGEFVVYENDKERVIGKTPGTPYVFSSTVGHKINKVKSNIRYSIIIFIYHDDNSDKVLI